jgi:hypothetical protein
VRGAAQGLVQTGYGTHPAPESDTEAAGRSREAEGEVNAAPATPFGLHGSVGTADGMAARGGEHAQRPSGIGSPARSVVVVELRQGDNVLAAQEPQWLDADYAARDTVFAALGVRPFRRRSPSSMEQEVDRSVHRRGVPTKDVLPQGQAPVARVGRRSRSA